MFVTHKKHLGITQIRLSLVHKEVLKIWTIVSFPKSQGGTIISIPLYLDFFKDSQYHRWCTLFLLDFIIDSKSLSVSVWSFSWTTERSNPGTLIDPRGNGKGNEPLHLVKREERIRSVDSKIQRHWTLFPNCVLELVLIFVLWHILDYDRYLPDVSDPR